MRANLKTWRESASLIIAAKTKLFNPKYDYNLLCLKRSSKTGFMPNAYVFPGGNIDQSDRSTEWLRLFSSFQRECFKDLCPVENAPPIFNSHDDPIPKYLSLRICAIRETFEECGILICRDKNSVQNNWCSFIDKKEILDWQERVHNNPDQFIQLCKQFSIYPDVWSLKLWSNWVTPPSMPSRFNTVFFISTFQQMPKVKPEEIEIQDLKWYNPDEFLQENKNERIIFGPPQYYELCRLRNFNSIDHLTAFAADRCKYGCEKYFPHRIASSDGLYSILPGDDLYPEEVDPNEQQIQEIENLPEGGGKNRIRHESIYSLKVIAENFTPKCNHKLPLSPEFNENSKL